MSTFRDRRRAILLPLGIETPEQLSAFAGISLGDAAYLMSVEELPPIFDAVARVSSAAHARMTWVSTGRSVVQADKTLHPDDRHALEIVSSLDEDERKQWFQVGDLLASS